MTSVLWFQGGACSGNTMSFIDAAEPSVVDLIVDFGLEIIYHPTLSMKIGKLVRTAGPRSPTTRCAGRTA